MQPANLLLDVRSIPPWMRHAHIFATFENLAEGQKLLLISDHEPRPLRAEFERAYGVRFAWVQRQIGDGRWEVRLSRLTENGERRAITSALRRSPIFESADDAQIEELTYGARRARIKRHHCVVEQGVLWPYLGIVESGIVQAVLTTAPGREQAMYDILPSELFAEIAFLDRGHTALRHVALTSETIVLLLPIDLIRSLAERDREIVRRIEESAAQRTRAILDRFAAHLSHSTTARVAQVLLPYAKPSIGLDAALAPLPTMTHTELALSAGTVKEVVSRALAELEARGAIRRKGGHISQLDRGQLLEMIEGESRRP